MNAQTYEQILDVETGIETGIRDALIAADWRVEDEKIQVLMQRDNIEAVTPRIEVQSESGGQFDNLFAQDRFGRLWPAAWRMNLSLTIYTNRTNNPSAHTELRARIRRFMAYAEAEKFTNNPEFFPWHVLTQIVEGSCTPSVETEDNLDVSQITFSCVVSVRNGVWPTTKN